MGAGGWSGGFLRLLDHFREAPGEQAEQALEQDSPDEWLNASLIGAVRRVPLC